MNKTLHIKKQYNKILMNLFLNLTNPKIFIKRCNYINIYKNSDKQKEGKIIDKKCCQTSHNMDNHQP